VTGRPVVRHPPDVGESMTRDQMREYAQAHAALAAGKPLRRLTWAARVGTVLLVAVVVWWLVWSVTN
jgi:hypothetical protein